MNQIQISDIIIQEKTEEVSWEQVRQVIYLAHTDSTKQGGVQIAAHLSGEALCQKIGSGTCFVAIYQGRVVGTCSVTIRVKTAWFNKGEAAYYMLDAVHPAFQGLSIYAMLDAKREAYVREKGLKVIYMYTSETNLKVQRLKEKQGYRLVSFAAFPQTDYYSVVMAKWLDGCPYPKWYCKFRFLLAKIHIKLRYREGLVKRFI